jgi:hypothetical protein
MSEQQQQQQQWRHQLRIDLADDLAEVARRDPADPALGPLPDILARHDTRLKCQYDAFAGYVAEAEREGVENYPLYRWTKATIEDPDKKRKFLKNFTLYVGGEEVYAKEKADALEAELRPLEGGPIVTKVSRYDTNPANNPQAPAQYRG